MNLIKELKDLLDVTSSEIRGDVSTLLPNNSARVSTNSGLLFVRVSEGLSITPGDVVIVENNVVTKVIGRKSSIPEYNT